MVPEETQVPKNTKTSINYIPTRDIWDRNNIIIDDIFTFTVALEITKNDEDPEQHAIESVDIDMIGQNGKKQCMQN